MRENLTNTRLKTLRPKAKPFDVMDRNQPGFGIRIAGTADRPVKSWILVKRFSGADNPARRVFGTYPEMGLEEAREKAREWSALVKKGIDPATEEKRQRRAEIERERQRQSFSFKSAFEAYLQRKASKLKSGPDIEREMRRELKAWMDWPLKDIGQREVKAAIQRKLDQGAATNARFLFSSIRGFFNWVVDSGDFDIEVSPCARIKPAVLIGPPNVRSRVLKDYEIAAYWRAAETMGYPTGSFYKLLLLTAVRRDEAANVVWSEIDLDEKLWVIPGERMKNGAAHAVPLTPDIVDLLSTLPRFSGDSVFSTTEGQRPISGFSKSKAKLDRLMRQDLASQSKPFEPFIIHDIRRTCRTRFSALPIEEAVRELLMAHARPGLHKVYDLHAYQEEKRHALELWHKKLRSVCHAV